MSSAAVVVGALRVKYSLMKCHTLFIRKLGEILEIVSSAAVVIGALREKFEYTQCWRECSGSVVECLTRDRRAAGSSLTGVTALCP